VAVSHATGMSGRMHERAIADGPIAVSLDLAAGIELLNSVTDGACSAGIYRLEAACRAGIPQIVSPGAHRGLPLGSGQTLSGPLQRSTWHRHSKLILMVRSSLEEIKKAARLMAEKLNQAKGHETVPL
jgi:uncharacterized protein (UPF0261 family)